MENWTSKWLYEIASIIQKKIISYSKISRFKNPEIWIQCLEKNSIFEELIENSENPQDWKIRLKIALKLKTQLLNSEKWLLTWENHFQNKKKPWCSKISRFKKLRWKSRNLNSKIQVNSNFGKTPRLKNKT